MHPKRHKESLNHTKKCQDFYTGKISAEAPSQRKEEMSFGHQLW